MACVTVKLVFMKYLKLHPVISQDCCQKHQMVMKESTSEMLDWLF